MFARAVPALALLFATMCGHSLAADLSFPNEQVDEWHGFTRHKFQADGCAAWLVEPKTALHGNPWSWCMEFPDAFTDRCAAPALLAAGFHHVHISVGNTFGSPDAMKHFNAFYELLSARGLAPKAALIGISRGGLYAYRFASEHPGRVAVIYGDAAVCDFKSWPGGKGTAKGSAGDWESLMKLYGFKDEAESLQTIAKKIGIPLNDALLIVFRFLQLDIIDYWSSNVLSLPGAQVPQASS